jgi:hypothetical protein
LNLRPLQIREGPGPTAEGRPPAVGSAGAKSFPRNHEINGLADSGGCPFSFLCVFCLHFTDKPYLSSFAIATVGVLANTRLAER